MGRSRPLRSNARRLDQGGMPIPSLVRVGRALALGLLVAAVSGALCATAASADDEMYRYTDDAGRTFYTDSYGSIPARYRDRASRVGDSAAGAGSFSVVPELAIRAPQTDREGAADSSPRAADPAPSRERAESWLRGMWGSLGVGVALSVIGVLAVVGLAISALLLKLSCALVGEQRIPFFAALRCVIVMIAASFVVAIPMQIVGASAVGLSAPLLWSVVTFGVGLGTQAAALHWLHCETLGGAVRVTIVYTLIPIGLGIALGIPAAGIGLLLG